jgi:predicted secreted protein
MSAIVGIDAKIEISLDNNVTWVELPERNEFSISISVDAAEHKVFVASLADAWVSKARTWMSWSGSLSGYFDDADDEIFDAVVAGNTIGIRFYVSRASNKVWKGNAILTSVEHSVNTDDFATLNVDFEGQGALTRATVP